MDHHFVSSSKRLMAIHSIWASSRTVRLNFLSGFIFMATKHTSWYTLRKQKHIGLAPTFISRPWPTRNEASNFLHNMNQLHYVSIDICKELTEANFPFTKKWYWYAECQLVQKTYDPIFMHRDEFYDTVKAKWNKWCDTNYIFIESPEVMDLLDELPSMIIREKLCILKVTKLLTWSYRVAYVNGNWYDVIFTEDTYPNSLARIWLILKEYNLLPKT